MNTKYVALSVRLLIIILILLSHAVPAQEKRPNHIFVELGGSAILYSINYERYFGNHFTARAGASYFAFPEIPSVIRPAKVLVFPVFGNILLGKSWFKVEAGAGGYLLNEIGGDGEFHATFLLGTRFELKSGYVFRLTYTPAYSYKNDRLVSWFGFSIGQRFSRL